MAGRYFHAPLLKGCGFEVAAVLTTNATRAGHAVEDFPKTVVVQTIEELVGGPQWYLNGEPIDTVEARHNFIVDKINAEQRYNKTIPNRD